MFTITSKELDDVFVNNSDRLKEVSPIIEQTDEISEYFIWTVVVAVFSGLIPAIPSLLLSLLTSHFKKQNRFRPAKIASTFTLAFNILLTCAIMCVIVYGVTYFTEKY